MPPFGVPSIPSWSATRASWFSKDSYTAGSGPPSGLALQVKLLRFLDDGAVWAVGAVKPKRPDVRIIALTNRDLEGMIAAGTFRRDIFYRLNVLCLEIPPCASTPKTFPAWWS